MAKVLVAMSGGVDSSVAALLLRDMGHECVGVTLKLWGGESDSGCCSVSDVEDARRVAEQIGIKHTVFNFSEIFEEKVVNHYIDSYSRGRTPNPCVECNRSIKFAALLERSVRLGFDFLATGHYAQVCRDDAGAYLVRGEDREKDQSYVLSMLQRKQIERLMLPIGSLAKPAVRDIARDHGLRTADKPDSLEVCFIPQRTGHDEFLRRRIPLTQARLKVGDQLHDAPAGVHAETLTIGQRRGLGTLGDSRRRYVVDKDLKSGIVVMGTERDLKVSEQRVESVVWVDPDGARDSLLEVQGAAHGGTVLAQLIEDRIVYRESRRKIAPGQTIALYAGSRVVGSAMISE
jgi:tRNA-specific 2-thiouridylase